MTEKTLYRREAQHRDRWSLYGAESGIEQLSRRLGASELRKYDVFEGFKDATLETISPDVTVAVWREGAVLFEEGSYVDVAFFVVEGAAAAYLSAHADADRLPVDSRPDAVVAAEDALAAPRGETVHLRQSRRQDRPAGEMTFLSAMDFDLGRESDVVTLGPGEFFGEIGALNGWPQSVTVKALTRCVVVQIRVPALRLLKRQSSAFRKRIDAVYRERALLRSCARAGSSAAVRNQCWRPSPSGAIWCRARRARSSSRRGLWSTTCTSCVPASCGCRDAWGRGAPRSPTSRRGRAWARSSCSSTAWIAPASGWPRSATESSSASRGATCSRRSARRRPASRSSGGRPSRGSRRPGRRWPTPARRSSLSSRSTRGWWRATASW